MDLCDYFSKFYSLKHCLVEKSEVWCRSLLEPYSVQFSSVTQSCMTLCHPMNCSTPGLPVHHQLPEFSQTHVHWVGNAIQPSLLPPIPPSIRTILNKCKYVKHSILDYKSHSIMLESYFFHCLHFSAIAYINGTHVD